MVTPLKGIHYLIDAFSSIAEEFRQSRLLIIGKEDNVGYADDLGVFYASGSNMIGICDCPWFSIKIIFYD